MTDIKLPPLPPFHIVPRVEPVDYPEVAQVLMDYARAAVLADREARQQEQPMELALCESRSLVLQIGRLYRFVPVDDCPKCQAMKREHDRAYFSDPTVPTPPPDAQRAKGESDGPA